MDRAAQHVREQGADCVMIGAHATEPPKHLYAALGFTPVCVTREYLKRLGRGTLDVCGTRQYGMPAA